MFTNTHAADLKLWIGVAKSSLHCGNKVGSARLHALQMMIDEEADTGYWPTGQEERKETLKNVSRLCLFAKKEHVTAHEKNIFIHIIIDLMETELRNLPTEPPRRLVDQPKQDEFGIDWEAPEPPQALDEPYPTEDSPEYLIPPSDLDELLSDDDLPYWLK